jgi:putative hydrolase of the HAD superfamily
MSFCAMLDVDGVVINGRPDDGQAWSTSLATDLGIDPTRLQTAFFRPYWAQIVTGKLDLAETLATCLPRVGARISARDFIDYWFTRDSRINREVIEDVGLLRAKGIRVILATNQEHLRAAHLMDALGLRQHVDGMVYSAQLGARKPERAFFTAAAAQVGLSPSSLLLVDDTRANVTAARAAGWRAWFWSGNRRLRDLTDL